MGTGRPEPTGSPGAVSRGGAGWSLPQTSPGRLSPFPGPPWSGRERGNPRGLWTSVKLTKLSDWAVEISREFP